VADSASNFSQCHATQGLVAGITGDGGVVRIFYIAAFAAYDVAVCVLSGRKKPDQ
jgi:hypothetical protein